MSEDVFGKYADYYNLLYKDKDYVGEACFVDTLIKCHNPVAKTLLNLGCGTGKHDFELSRLGYDITGIDVSDEMLSAAQHHMAIGDPSAESIRFMQGDIRMVRLDQLFDVVISLFHVFSYQTSNEDLLAAFSTAGTHLSRDGVFIFDCWYGPAVLTDPPVVRVKRCCDGKFDCIRIAEPVMHPNDNIVDVNYHIILSDRETGLSREFRETHRMRYFFMPELNYFLQQVGLRIVKSSEWLTNRNPGFDTWGVSFVVVKR